jgi:acyl-coenzyme A thioesterase PaaI-like protein
MKNWPKLKLNPPKEYDHCIGCGNSNPIGLKMKFNWDEATKTVSTEFTPGENFQGWSGYLHGGITALVLDEAMGWVAMFAGTNNVTAKMQVRFRQMVPIGQTYTVSCTVTKQTTRLIETQATLKDKKGEVLAEATSTQFIVGSREKAAKEKN